MNKTYELYTSCFFIVGDFGLGLLSVIYWVVLGLGL